MAEKTNVVITIENGTATIAVFQEDEASPRFPELEPFGAHCDDDIEVIAIKEEILESYIEETLETAEEEPDFPLGFDQHRCPSCGFTNHFDAIPHQARHPRHENSRRPHGPAISFHPHASQHHPLNIEFPGHRTFGFHPYFGMM